MLFLALLSIKLIAAVNVKERNEIKYRFADNKSALRQMWNLSKISDQQSGERSKYVDSSKEISVNTAE